MPRIADYAIVSDSTFRIQSSGGSNDQQLSIDLDNGVHIASRSVCSFTLAAQPGADSPRLRVSVNGSQQLNGTLQDGPFVTTLQEVINANVLRHGANQFRFELVDGTGTLDISDVVLHYQRDI